MRDVVRAIEHALVAAEAPATEGAQVVLTDALEHGDVAANHALVLARHHRRPPRLVAEELARALEGTVSDTANVAVAGPGFLNFTLTDSALTRILREVLAMPDAWGGGVARQGQRVVVEYTQPNPFKAFHIGHLMSNTVGEALARLVAVQGASVVRANYQGDVGPHVAKALWAIMEGGDRYCVDDVADLGRAYAEGVRAYEENPAARQAIEAINKRLYQLLAGQNPTSSDDKQLLALYERGRAASLAHFEALYHILGTSFDAYFFESEAAPVGTKLVQEGLAQGVFEESEGAVIFRGERCSPPRHTRVFLTRHGTPTYEAKELGLVALKLARFGDFTENITVVAVEQEEYGHLMECAIARMWPALAGKYRFVTHGILQLTSGKMSSRTGKVITGESLLNELRERAHVLAQKRVGADQVERVATAMAVAAVRFAVLRHGRGKNVRFDPHTSLSLTGDTGPYVQYTHARAAGLLARARAEGLIPSSAATDAMLRSALSFAPLVPEAREVARLTVRFPVVVDRAHDALEPSLLAHYLLTLAAAFNRWYDREPIVRHDQREALPRLALVRAVQITLSRGLTLLGIEPLEEM